MKWSFWHSLHQGIDEGDICKEIASILEISVIVFLWKLGMVMWKVVLKMRFRIVIIAEIVSQNDEFEWKHIVARGKVDIIFLMSSEDKLANTHDSGKVIPHLWRE